MWFRAAARKLALSGRRAEIVYYAPREEKTWTVHNSCKLPPEPKASVANTSCGLANFIPVVRILFFAIPGPKTPHSRFGAGRECGTFGQGVAKTQFSVFSIFYNTFFFLSNPVSVQLYLSTSLISL